MIAPTPCGEHLGDDTTCTQPTEVVDRWVWDSSHGPLEHRRVRCLAGHVAVAVSSSTSVSQLPPLLATTPVRPHTAARAAEAHGLPTLG